MWVCITWSYYFISQLIKNSPYFVIFYLDFVMNCCLTCFSWFVVGTFRSFAIIVLMYCLFKCAQISHVTWQRKLLYHLILIGITYCGLTCIIISDLMYVLVDDLMSLVFIVFTHLILVECNYTLDANWRLFRSLILS